MDYSKLSKIADSVNPIADKRIEDPEVVAELMSNIESALDKSAQPYEADKSDIVVDYDGDIDCIRVEWPSISAEAISDIKVAIENVLDGNYYLTESLVPDYPLFYVCFDSETADLFNDSDKISDSFDKVGSVRVSPAAFSNFITSNNLESVQDIDGIDVMENGSIIGRYDFVEKSFNCTDRGFDLIESFLND